jgi:hypothetical protein
MNVDCKIHVLSCRKGPCNVIHKLITILLKYRLSFTFLFDNFPITCTVTTTARLVYRLHMLVSLFVPTTLIHGPNLQRQYLDAENIWTTRPSLPLSSVINDWILFRQLCSVDPPPPHYNWSIGNSWRGQFKCGLHEMCWDSGRSWNYAIFSVRDRINWVVFLLLFVL